MALTLVLGLFLFVGLLVLFLVMLPASSVESVLLEEVARGSRRADEATRSALNLDVLAKPLIVLRRLVSVEPNPAQVRRLMLAGYRVFHDFLITDKPRRIRNIDHIVIGANGIFAVETKTRRKMKGENGAKVMIRAWTRR